MIKRLLKSIQLNVLLDTEGLTQEAVVRLLPPLRKHLALLDKMPLVANQAAPVVIDEVFPERLQDQALLLYRAYRKKLDLPPSEAVMRLLFLRLPAAWIPEEHATDKAALVEEACSVGIEVDLVQWEVQHAEFS